jgi:hypothetical protein
MRSGGVRGSKLKVSSLVLGLSLLLVPLTYAFIIVKDPERLILSAGSIALDYKAKEKAP